MCICTYGEVLHLVGNLVEHLVLAHAVGVVVAAEADDNEAVFFAEDRLIDVPAGAEMREDDGTHGRALEMGLLLFLASVRRSVVGRLYLLVFLHTLR